MRMLNDDWNDALVMFWGQRTMKETVAKGESVLNSAMAAWVFDYYARMLAYAGEDPQPVAHDPAEGRGASQSGPRAVDRQVAAARLARPHRRDGWARRVCGSSRSRGPSSAESRTRRKQGTDRHHG